MQPAETKRLIAGRYRLGNMVGRGGMGIVWQARDELLGREVAVKELIWPAYFSTKERQAARRRAVREARAAARISHPNVIRVFDILEETDCPWIVMELLPPRSLRDLVLEDGPLSPAQAAGVGLEILAALCAAHALGVVHRDVKPANILMAPDRAVLVDFGIAQAAESSVEVTTASMLIGSPAYIAPERARGGPSGPPADLWGLGASLYAAVEGSGPFERDGGALASLTAVVADEPEPAAHAGPLLWPVISGLLRKDPAERLNAAEAERMLRLVVAPARPVNTATHERRSPRPLVAALAGSALLALVSVSVAVAVLDRPGQGRPTASTSAPMATTELPGTRLTTSVPAATAGPSGKHLAAPGPRQPAAGATPRTISGTHLAVQASPTPSSPAVTSPHVEAEIKPGQKSSPPGHQTNPGKPGKGKAKGKGKKNGS
jgi:serine/threonine protein kinase